MTHELKQLLFSYHLWKLQGIKSVMATVVALEGSSYRRPGVRMLISETGEIEGAISGGCVEKEVIHQCKSVFTTGIPKIMTYDGRYRLGCEGLLYVLLEPINITEEVYDIITESINKRKVFHTTSFYECEFIENINFGTVVEIEGQILPLRTSFLTKNTNAFKRFHQQFSPIFQLYIFGSEHDAVQLCTLASNIGWEVHIIASPEEKKTINYFKGAKSLSTPLIQSIDVSNIGENTAVVLMSHSLNKDLRYLMLLKDKQPSYIGILGSEKRRERIFSEFLDFFPETSYHFFESIYSPAGINIGAETSAEIALSIISEILSVTRNTQLMPLREKLGKIHD